jgi:hypothetical protein
MTDLDERLVVERPVRASLPNDTAVGALRPVMPKRGLPRLMRRLIGVDEDILDWVPEERPRYTRLGFIVVNTGVLAGVSMHMALASVLGNHWWLLFADLLWALIIITIDSWLISSTHGVPRTSLFGTYAPRIVVSILLGLAIAEPLVLTVFHQSISNEIQDHRKAEVDRYETEVKRCNPPSGSLVSDPACKGFLVTISESAQALKDKQVQATENRDTLKKRADEVDGKLAELERLARDECAGRSGPGLTAIPGEGRECIRNRAIADQYRRDNQVEQLHRDLQAAEQAVAAMPQVVADASGKTERETNAAITAMVEEKRANLVDRGLLDEFDALGRLSAKSFVVFIVHILLALLLVALDCLPVLSKLMSNRTEYDSRLRQQLDASGRLHDRQLQASEKRDSVDYELQERRFTQKLRVGIEDIGGEDRNAKVRRKIQMDAQIDELAAALERQS